MAFIGSSPLGLTLDTKIAATPSYGDGVSISSQFNHPNQNTIIFTPWPEGPLNDKGDPAKRRNIHSDEIYDSRISNIISSTDKIFKVEKGNTYYPTKLKAQDFAYLKNVGVYPNNRLMVARRYGSPVVDDPAQIGQDPIATLISWVPEGQDYLQIEFGEEWEAAKASFTDIFNEIGKDIMVAGLGSGAAGGAGAIPLPGFTEIFQRQIMEKLGIAAKGSDQFIPSGTPNLIKEAKQRKTIDPDTAGSGLKASVSIKMICEWEQKFIAGVDPSIAWMDIIQMCLRFGTSPSVSYLGTTKASQQLVKFINDLANNPLKAIADIMDKIKESLKSVLDEVSAALQGEESEDDEEDEGPQFDVGDFLKKISSDILSGLAKKYKVKLIGVVHALTGAASTPWHITVGNPLRPVFCSGDMIVDSVTLTLGDMLAFNDLPSTIKVEFTLKNARNWGLQEIQAKFNVGYTRTVKVRKELYESDVDADFIPPTGDVIGGGKNIANQSGDSPSSVPNQTEIAGSTINNKDPLSGGGNLSQVDEIPGTGTSGIGNSFAGNTDVDNKSVNPDPNSTDIVTSESNQSSFVARNRQQDNLEDQLSGISN